MNPETPIQKNLCTPMFIAAQFTIGKCRRQPKCPSVNEGSKTWYIYMMGDCSRKEEGTPTLRDSMDGSEEHCAK